MENKQLAEAIKNMNFENAYERLNETTTKLERGNLSLEASLELYEEGVLLSQRCEELLNNAQLRVSQIVEVNAKPDEEEEDDYLYEEADDE